MIRMYDDNGNVIDIVEHDREIYNKAIDEFAEFYINAECPDTRVNCGDDDYACVKCVADKFKQLKEQNNA